MPIILTVDHALKWVNAVVIGPVSFNDIQDHLAIERRFGGLPYSEFIDARGGSFVLTSVEVRGVVELIRNLGQESKLGAAAVLVGNEVDFGVIHMLETLLEEVCTVKPFRDEHEARAWLAMQ